MSAAGRHGVYTGIASCSRPPRICPTVLPTPEASPRSSGSLHRLAVLRFIQRDYRRKFSRPRRSRRFCSLGRLNCAHSTVHNSPRQGFCRDQIAPPNCASTLRLIRTHAIGLRPSARLAPASSSAVGISACMRLSPYPSPTLWPHIARRPRGTFNICCGRVGCVGES